MNRSFSKKRHIQMVNENLEKRFLIKEDMEMSTDKSKVEGRNNPVWMKLVSSLKNLSFPPKILTFDTYSNPPVKSQSLNWGTAAGSGNYALAISATDKETPNENMDLFSDDEKLQNEMYKWWNRRGYKSRYDGQIEINYNDADKLKSDLESFFKIFPPVGKISKSGGEERNNM